MACKGHSLQMPRAPINGIFNRHVRGTASALRQWMESSVIPPKCVILDSVWSLESPSPDLSLAGPIHVTLTSHFSFLQPATEVQWLFIVKPSKYNPQHTVAQNNIAWEHGAAYIHKVQKLQTGRALRSFVWVAQQLVVFRQAFRLTL